MHQNSAFGTDFTYVGMPATIRKGAKMQGCSFNAAGVNVIVKDATHRARSQLVNGFQCELQSVWMIVEHRGMTGGIWMDDLDFSHSNAK